MELIRYVSEEILKEFYGHEIDIGALVELSDFDMLDAEDNELEYEIKIIVPELKKQKEGEKYGN